MDSTIDAWCIRNRLKVQPTSYLLHYRNTLAIQRSTMYNQGNGYNYKIARITVIIHLINATLMARHNQVLRYLS